MRSNSSSLGARLAEQVYLLVNVLMKSALLLFAFNELLHPTKDGNSPMCASVTPRHARVLQNNETGGLSRPRYPNRAGFRQDVGQVAGATGVACCMEFLATVRVDVVERRVGQDVAFICIHNVAQKHGMHGNCKAQ